MVKVGIDLIDKNLKLFKNKKVGLITNPTGVNSNLVSTIDILNEKTELVALYSPEHGVRGDLQAGVRLDDYVDPKTGCMVYSLYGKNKKPTEEMLSDIDVLCYDIQDVGARFYTYIYTMAYSMMAAKEYNKKFVVFDRPNPLNGIDVEGNILDLEFRSFVGFYPIVQRYGLTVGELANFFNEEFNIGCDLEVIKMENYQRSMYYRDTLLPWVFPSPNLPTSDMALTYVGTCIFEGTNLSEGRGTTKPFELIGAPWLDSELVVSKLNEMDIPGVKFRKAYFTPTFSKHKGDLCNGVEVIITNKTLYRPVTTGMIMLDVIKKSSEEFKFLPPYKEGLNQMIDLLTGGNFVRTGLLDINEIISLIERDAEVFKEKKVRYHLYE